MEAPAAATEGRGESRPDATAADTRGATADAAATTALAPPAAAPSIFQRLSTDALPPGDRFDFWRSISTAAVTEPIPPIGARGFHGEFLHTKPWHGTTFMRIENDPMHCRFDGDETDGITIVRVRTGIARARSVRGGRAASVLVSAASGFVLLDHHQPVDLVEPLPFVMTSLKLPGGLIREALGSGALRSWAAIRPAASPGPLASGLLWQLDAITDCGRWRTAAEADAAVDIARSVVMTLLAQQNAHRRLLPEPFDAALLTTARLELRRYAANPDLTAQQVAAMLGCSRAHLYQLFKQQGTTVGDELREARMRRACRLLGSDAEIGDIAWRCGYTEFSAFDRAFRQRFRMTPTEYRHLIASRGK